MNTRDTIFRLYEHQLAAFAALDRAYYASKAPSADDRAAYFERQEEIEAIRARMYQELGAAQSKKLPQKVITSAGCYSIALPNESIHQLCQIKHDALNKLSVALARTQLLAEAVEKDSNAIYDIATILEALKQMTNCLRQPCPGEAKRVLNQLAANR